MKTWSLTFASDDISQAGPAGNSSVTFRLWRDAQSSSIFAHRLDVCQHLPLEALVFLLGRQALICSG